MVASSMSLKKICKLYNTYISVTDISYLYCLSSRVSLIYLYWIAMRHAYCQMESYIPS